ncbi:MAG: chemotaxis protein CheX [bacterium]
MDVNNINAVVDAMLSVIPQLGFESITKTGVKASGSFIQNPGVVINIGVIGQLKGSIVFLMDVDSAKKFASKMMMGMEVNEFDEISQSALAEMSNIVCANACTNLSQIGVNGLDISPPTLIFGKNGTIKVSAPMIILLQFTVDDINMQLGVGLT